jgi:hypothetical protein
LFEGFAESFVGVAMDLREVGGMEGEAFEEGEEDAVAAGIDRAEVPPFVGTGSVEGMGGFLGPAGAGGLRVHAGHSSGRVHDHGLDGDLLLHVSLKAVERNDGYPTAVAKTKGQGLQMSVGPTFEYNGRWGVAPPFISVKGKYLFP